MKCLSAPIPFPLRFAVVRFLQRMNKSRSEGTEAATGPISISDAGSPGKVNHTLLFFHCIAFTFES